MNDPVRIYVHEEYLDDACWALDDAGIPYDMDGGNRIMVDACDLDDAAEALEDAGIDYEEI